MAKQQQRTRRSFKEEFRAEAVRRMTDRRGQGVSLQQIGRELDVSADMLRSWAHQLKAGAEGPLAEVFLGQGRLPSDQEELRRLQRENHRL